MRVSCLSHCACGGAALGCVLNQGGTGSQYDSYVCVYTYCAHGSSSMATLQFKHPKCQLKIIHDVHKKKYCRHSIPVAAAIIA